MACAPPRISDGGEGLLAVGASELPILEAVAEAFVPSGGAFGPGAREVGLARRMDALAAAQGPDVVRGVRGALWLLELGGGPLCGRWSRFSALSLDQRTECLQALVESRIALAREIFAGLKQLSLFTFYSIDASWPATGYDGPWVQQEARRA